MTAAEAKVQGKDARGEGIRNQPQDKAEGKGRGACKEGSEEYEETRLDTVCAI